MRLLDYIRHVKPDYVADWYHELICEELERAVKQRSSLLVSAPPGSGKTELISILFPSWLIEEDAMTNLISLSNSDSLARLASGNILRIVRSEAFREICPIELDKETEATFTVTGNNGRPTLHSAGIMGQLTGSRAHVIIADDLVKNLADAYSETIRERTWLQFQSCAETRLYPQGIVVSIGTRWHLDDWIGRAIKRARENEFARQYTFINLSATNNGHEAYIERTYER